MKYDNLQTFKNHLEEASKSSSFHSIYCVISKEPYECRVGVELLLSYLLKNSDPRELALCSLDGSLLEEKKLYSELATTSLFVKRRVVLISQADKLKKNVQEKLVKLISEPILGKFVILVANGLQKNTLFYKGIDSKGILLEYREIKPWEKEKRLVEWVIQQTGAYRKLIAYPAAQYLVKQVGNDQFLLEKEVEKLVCYCFEKSEISLKDVEAICVKQHHDTIWELGEFIFRRDASAAIQAARALLLEEQSALPLLRQVRFQFQTHFQICHLLNHENALDEIAREFPYMKGKILESHINQARSYGLEAFRNGIIEIDATEARIKNSAIDENILIEILLHRLTNPKLK